MLMHICYMLPIIFLVAMEFHGKMCDRRTFELNYYIFSCRLLMCILSFPNDFSFSLKYNLVSLAALFLFDCKISYSGLFPNITPVATRRVQTSW